MEKYFIGKRALVTGGSQGIGRGIAEKLASLGAQVFVLDKAEAKFDSSLIKHVTVDLLDWENTRKAVESVLPIQLLVNNAGIAQHQSIFNLTKEEFDLTFGVNTRAPLCTIQSVVKDLVKRQQEGAIVNISSQASMVALEDHIIYCGSKGGIDAMTRCCALELGPHKIRINCVNPTVVNTELGKQVWGDPKVRDPMLKKIPLQRFAEVEDVVNAVIFLLSDQAAMISGTCLPVDGGFIAT